MPDEDKTSFSGSFLLDLRMWWRHVHTLYSLTRLPKATILGSFCEYRSTDYVRLRKTKEIKNRKQNNSK